MSNTSYRQRVNEDARLRILQILAEDTGYTVNDRILSSCLADLGHGLSADTLASHLAWLAEQSLVTTETVSSGPSAITVATLTQRGQDVAAGRARTPGVARPRPQG